MSEKRRMRSREHEAMKMFCAADTVMSTWAGDLEQRLRSVKNGWRDWRMLQTRMRDLRERLYDSVPDEQIATMERNLSRMEMRVAATHVAKEEDFVYISLTALKTLVSYAMATECNFCAKGKQEARQCPLRKALDSWTTHNMEEVDGCAYRGGTVA